MLRVAARRSGASAAAAGRRLSAADLRARGVDEAFLAPAQCIEAQEEPPAAPEDSGKIAFLSAGLLVDEGELSGASLGALGGAASPPPRGAGAPAGPPKKLPEHQAEWTAKRLQAEYGVGYRLLVTMGYQGGGQLPLAPVKRIERVGLQDDERTAVDTSFVGVPPRKRRRRHGRARSAASAAAGSEAAEEGPQEEADDASEDDSTEGGAGDVAGRLRRAIVAEVRRKGSNARLTLAALIRRPRVRSALAGREESGNKLRQFVRRFIRSDVPACQLVRTAVAGQWLKGPAAGSFSEELVVILRQVSADAADGDAGGYQSSSSAGSGSPAGPHRHPRRPLACQRDDGFVRWHCHGCKAAFAGKAALRDHVLERLTARTTVDPTDLRAAFDAEHQDREALQRAAAVAVGRPGGRADEVCAILGLCCPVCGWMGEDQGGCGSVAALLDHARDAPGAAGGARLAHRRFLTLVAELLVRESLQGGDREEVTHSATSPWCSPALVQLFLTLGGTRCADARPEYRKMEDELLGPAEEDMFAAS